MTDRVNVVAHEVLGESTDIARSIGTTTQVGVLCILAAELRRLREAIERHPEL